ncbi:hypothetical protein P168DRAFT_345196 [Aspergillus campestris IBT 28561]|uniref:Zn(2)-C6 fungal-type domain-containing protein n=1 Tax=Aspergillus campestris (strain IBT 28561) TaxID=1392248 RepID=A0A2I1D229_ASPC2|nr:uncharacterized protein P168DRAFT_345196 [Aspergillus campestris IBT 28561]PKY03898.1 hypothetical protein P168DRAFT_345196 [Aspergillus campestris IBT 28561]
MSGTRSRKGCATCRERRQKCDETKPTCVNCRSRGIECGGYAIRLTDFNHYEGYDGQMVCKMIRGEDSAGRPPRPRLRAKRRKVRPAVFEVDPDVRTQRNPRLSDCNHPGRSPPASQPQPPPEEALESPVDNDPFSWMKTPDDTNTAGHRRGSQTASDSSPQGAGEDPFLWPDLPTPISSDFLFSRPDDLSMDISCPSSLPGLLSPTLWPDNLALGLSPLPGLSAIFDEPQEGTVRPAERVKTALGAVDLCSASPHKGADQHVGGLLSEVDDRCVFTSTPNDPGVFENYLFKHFVDVLAPSLYPLDPDRNPYTVVYATLAGTSQALYNAILSASANHLVTLGQLPIWAVGPYRQAMQDSFRRAVGSGTVCRSTAAAVLLCIAAEVIGSGMGAWSVKLGGAHRLLANATKGDGIPSDSKFLWLQYTWMSAIGRTLWIPKSSPMQLADIQPPEHDLDLQLAQEQKHWYGNMPDYAMVHFLRKASTIAHQLSQVPSYANPIQATQRLTPYIADLLNEVRNWHPQPSSSTIDPYANCAAEVGEIWRQGLLCYIYAELCSLPSSDARIQEGVAAALAAIQKLSWMQSVLWPVFMIGLHALGEEDRGVVERGLLAMNAALKFKTPLSLVGILRRVWDGDIGDWRGLVSREGMELNILL